MTDTTLDEWVDCPEPGETARDRRGQHPSGGYAGKLNAAENHAPPGATFEEIRDVAKEAFDRGAKVERIWSERQSDVTEF